MDEFESQTEKKKPKKEKTEKKDKVPDSVLYDAVAGAINHDPLSLLPVFPRFFYVKILNTGKTQIFEELAEGEKIVKPINEEAVINEVIRFTSSYEMSKFHNYRWDARKCANAVTFWVAHAQVIDEILPFSELSENVWCYHKLPFDLEHDLTKTPLFDELLSRCGNAAALINFTGSLFHKDSDRQQYLWMYGEGNNGKSAYVRILEKVFASAFQPEDSTHSKNNRFWTGGLVGKRVVAFTDSNSPTFVLSGLCKQITGDDRVPVELKGGIRYSERLDCKLIFLSNERPGILNNVADVRRLIFVEVKPIVGEPDAEYEDRLWQEVPYILGNCKASYFAMLGDRKRAVIQVEKDALDILLEENETQYEAFFEKNFAKCSQLEGIAATALYGVFVENRVTNTREYKKYIEFFFRKYGITRGRSKIKRAYMGMRRKTFAERNMHDIQMDQIVREEPQEPTENVTPIRKPKKLTDIEVNPDGKTRSISVEDLLNME